MNDQEKVLNLYIEEQQNKINELSQQIMMLTTRNRFLEEKLKEFDVFNDTIRELKKTKLQNERKIKSLSETSKGLNGKIKTKDEEIKTLKEKLYKYEYQSRQQKTVTTGFSHQKKIVK